VQLGMSALGQKRTLLRCADERRSRANDGVDYRPGILRKTLPINWSIICCC
jgi:hypothetical protein